jgi:hypothetical protein
MDDLHESAFDFRPKKEGWQDVIHNVRERPEGKRARHQLDVTAKHPDGHIARLIVECKDWDKTVGKGTLDALVGVRKQVGADATAVVTTKGFTRGARSVAADEGVALVLLTPFSENPINYVKTIKLEIKPFGPPEFSDFDIELMPDHGLALDQPFSIKMRGDDRLRRLDGTPAETVMEVLRSQAGPLEAGVFQRRAAFEDGRLAKGTDGSAIPIAALVWSEASVAGEPMVISDQAKGEPLLVLQHLDENGQVASGRVVVDRDLFAWEIDQHGNVSRSSQLGSRPRQLP